MPREPEPWGGTGTVEKVWVSRWVPETELGEEFGLREAVSPQETRQEAAVTSEQGLLGPGQRHWEWAVEDGMGECGGNWEGHCWLGKHRRGRGHSHSGNCPVAGGQGRELPALPPTKEMSRGGWRGGACRVQLPRPRASHAWLNRLNLGLFINEMGVLAGRIRYSTVLSTWDSTSPACLPC